MVKYPFMYWYSEMHAIDLSSIAVYTATFAVTFLASGKNLLTFNSIKMTQDTLVFIIF